MNNERKEVGQKQSIGGDCESSRIRNNLFIDIKRRSRTSFNNSLYARQVTVREWENDVLKHNRTTINEKKILSQI